MTNAESHDTVATVAAPGAPTAPVKAAAKKTSSRNKRAPQGRAGAKAKKAKATKRRQAKPRTLSKGAQILELIRRVKGATLAEIMQATAWQVHSVRGFISTAANKHGVKIDSSKNKAGARVYRISR